MRDLAIAIRIGSKDSNLELVRGTIESIRKNMGQCDFCFMISLGLDIRPEVKDYIYQKQKEYPLQFKILGQENIYWSEFINKAIEKSQDFEYFIKAHDDIILQTPDFFPKVKKIISSLKEPVAWVSFREMSYLEGHWNPSTRPGYHKDFLYQDAWSKRKMFEFHGLPDNWYKPSLLQRFLYFIQIKVISKISQNVVLFKYPVKKMQKEMEAKLDIPKKPVKCHAPWNTFVLIKMSVLNELGPCEHWQTYNALLVDEDWGLRALEKKYWNIWIPEIKYLHVKPPIGGDRSQFQIKNDSNRVAELFLKKWGFHVKPSEKELENIKATFKDTFIPWSIGRNSYDWDYIQ